MSARPGAAAGEDGPGPRGRGTWGQLAVVAQVARLGAVQERWWLTVLPVVTGLVTALLAPSYASTYSTRADLDQAVAAAGASQASRFLYGPLAPRAGTVQLATWELGGLTCLALAVVVTLRAVSVSRGQEDAGRSELLRSSGARPGSEVTGQALVLVALCLLLGLGAGLGLLALRPAGVLDAVLYGGVVGTTCLVVAVVALVVAQLVPDAQSGRGGALAATGLMYAGAGMRAARHWDWAGWASPFRLRALVDPGGQNSSGPLAAAVAVAVAVVLAAFLAAHRDLGLGLVETGHSRRARMRVAGTLSFAARMSLRQCTAWAALIALVTWVVAVLGENMVDLARQGALGEDSSLGSIMAGRDPGEAFLGYVGALAGALAAAQGVSLASRCGSEECSGRLETASRGPAPGRFLLSWWLVAAVGSGLSLAAAALAASLAGEVALGTDTADAVRLVAGQWPAALACCAAASALCGLRPAVRGLAWVPLLTGLGVAQLGGVLDLPQPVRDAGLFAQAGQRGALWLAGIALACLVAGLTGISRRDMALVAEGEPAP